jgi:hypothetical protein
MLGRRDNDDLLDRAATAQLGGEPKRKGGFAGARRR